MRVYRCTYNIILSRTPNSSKPKKSVSFIGENDKINHNSTKTNRRQYAGHASIFLYPKRTSVVLRKTAAQPVYICWTETQHESFLNALRLRRKIIDVLFSIYVIYVCNSMSVTDDVIGEHQRVVRQYFIRGRRNNVNIYNLAGLFKTS